MKSSSSGYQGERHTSKRDLGAGSGAPKKGGTGYLSKSKSSRDLGSGSKSNPTDTGHRWGVKKAKGASGVKRLPKDGVGGPL